MHQLEWHLQLPSPSPSYPSQLPLTSTPPSPSPISFVSICIYTISISISNSTSSFSICFVHDETRGGLRRSLLTPSSICHGLPIRPTCRSDPQQRETASLHASIAPSRSLMYFINRITSHMSTTATTLRCWIAISPYQYQYTFPPDSLRPDGARPQLLSSLPTTR